MDNYKDWVDLIAWLKKQIEFQEQFAPKGWREKVVAFKMTLHFMELKVIVVPKEILKPINLTPDFIGKHAHE